MLPLRLPQGRQLPPSPGRPGARGPAQPLRRAATRGRHPHRSFPGRLRARQVYSLRKLPPRGGEGGRTVGAGLRGSRIRRPRCRPAGRCLVGGLATRRAGVRGGLPHRRLGPQAGKRSGGGCGTTCRVGPSEPAFPGAPIAFRFGIRLPATSKSVPKALASVARGSVPPYSSDPSPRTAGTASPSWPGRGSRCRPGGERADPRRAVDRARHPLPVRLPRPYADT